MAIRQLRTFDRPALLEQEPLEIQLSKVVANINKGDYLAAFQQGSAAFQKFSNIQAEAQDMLQENLDTAMDDKAAEMIAEAHQRDARRIKTKPSRSAKAKRVDTKKARAKVKQARGRVQMD